MRKNDGTALARPDRHGRDRGVREADARLTRLAVCPVGPKIAEKARKVLVWPKRCKLAHAFLWEYS